MIDDEVGKYRKKSTAKGQPRSKHKHIYETVLLTTEFKHNTGFDGKPHTSYSTFPTNVCIVCGRVDDVQWDEKYYVIEPTYQNIYCYNKKLSELALSLPKYKCNFLDKFATLEEETNDDED